MPAFLAQPLATDHWYVVLYCVILLQILSGSGHNTRARFTLQVDTHDSDTQAAGKCELALNHMGISGVEHISKSAYVTDTGNYHKS